MKITLNREEALSCVIALERIKKLCGWERLALDKLVKGMGLKPSPLK